MINGELVCVKKNGEPVDYLANLGDGLGGGAPKNPKYAAAANATGADGSFDITKLRKKRGGAKT
jgi:hypothetical protein